MAKYRKEPETSVTDIIETRINKPSQVYNYRPDIDPGQDLSNYYTKSEVDSKIDAAVIHYQAGENVRISGSTISATDTTYQSSDFDIKYLSDEDDLRTTWSNKQDQLIAGNNISIDNNVISATVDPDLSEYYTKTEVNNIINGIDIPEYTAGTNVSIDANNVISATDTTYTASDFDIKDLLDTNGLKSTWSNKQDALTAGENVSISNNVISATDTTYTASDFDIKDLLDTNGLKSTWSNKQDALTAGSNISINNGTISATDTTYQSSDFDIKDLSDSTDLKSTWNNKQDQLTAGNNITIENNVISANEPDLTDYYTKSEVDELIPSVSSGVPKINSSIAELELNEIGQKQSGSNNDMIEGYFYKRKDVTGIIYGDTTSSIEFTVSRNFYGNNMGDTITQQYYESSLQISINDATELYYRDSDNESFYFLAFKPDIVKSDIELPEFRLMEVTYVIYPYAYRSVTSKSDRSSNYIIDYDNPIEIQPGGYYRDTVIYKGEVASYSGASSAINYLDGTETISPYRKFAWIATHCGYIPFIITHDSSKLLITRELPFNRIPYSYFDNASESLTIQCQTYEFGDVPRSVRVDTQPSVDLTEFATKNYVDTSVNNKVDKVSGKSLSTNDFTDSYKNKLDNIEENANNYSLPTASDNTLGGIKVGNNLSIDANGVLSATSNITIDSQLSSTSENAVQNKVLYDELRITENVIESVLTVNGTNYPIVELDYSQLTDKSWNDNYDTWHDMVLFEDFDPSKAYRVINVPASSYKGIAFTSPGTFICISGDDEEDGFVPFFDSYTSDPLYTQGNWFAVTIENTDFYRDGSEEVDGETVIINDPTPYYGTNMQDIHASELSSAIETTSSTSTVKSLKQKIAELERGDNLWTSVTD